MFEKYNSLRFGGYANKCARAQTSHGHLPRDYDVTTPDHSCWATTGPRSVDLVAYKVAREIQIAAKGHNNHWS